LVKHKVRGKERAATQAPRQTRWRLIAESCAAGDDRRAAKLPQQPSQENVRPICSAAMCARQTFFTARRYASAVLAVGLCPSVSVRLSHVGVLSKRMNEWSWLWHVSFLLPVQHHVKGKFGYLKK